MSKKIILRTTVLLLIVGLFVIFLKALKGEEFYMVSICLMGLILFPFFFFFDRKIQMRDIVILSVMCGVSAVARVAFFMLPQCKPMAAIVIITGCALGPEAGFATGAFSIFLSNFYFGQGPYTPFQMVAMGGVGFLAGLFFFHHENVKRWKVILFGVLSTTFIYGAIVDLNTIFLVSQKPTWEMAMATYAVALPMDLIHGVATGVFLSILYQPVLQKLERVQRKYGI